jgi:hypothetical protein
VAGVRLSLPLDAGSIPDEIAIETAHCERLFRVARYRAIRDGRIDPGDPVTARLVPGRERARHGATRCLETFRVELRDEGGRVVTRIEFPREVFGAFVVARATHLLAAARRGLDERVVYSLHATEDDDLPFPVEIPVLAPLCVARLAACSVRRGDAGERDDAWTETFMTPQVCAGLGEIEEASRRSGLEVAGRIHARVGFDAEAGCFVRILERLVIARETRATVHTVVSTAASWGDFLAAGTAGPQAYTSVHTHVHLVRPGTRAAGEAPRPAADGDGALASDTPCISIDDIVTHFVTFPDPLSAALIVSLFPDRRDVALYGYTRLGVLRREAGYWELPEERAGASQQEEEYPDATTET